MPSIDPHDQRRGRWVSRRQILGAGAGCLSLLLKGVAAAEEEKPPRPRFLLAWGRRGKENGEFSANVARGTSKKVSDSRRAAALPSVDDFES